MGSLLFDPKRVIALVGPTGSGKTSVALELGNALEAEIVCMDSMQLYRELELGTARPTPSELARLPHHLYGSVSIAETMTSVRYCALAQDKIAEIQARGKLALLVGGTGLYLRALAEGLDPMPPTPLALRQRLSERLRRRGLARMYRLLRRLDPRAAEHLHQNDSQRIQRFLEVRLLSGQSMLAHWQPQAGAAPRLITVGLSVERAVLVERIQQRARLTLASGWLDEVRRLKELGLLTRVFELAPIGYREIAQYIDGKISYQTMEELICIATRQYAKRQMTWFRKAAYIQWFPFNQDSGYNIQCVTDFIKKEMGLPSDSEY